jgi:hypothetical protein
MLTVFQKIIEVKNRTFSRYILIEIQPLSQGIDWSVELNVKFKQLIVLDSKATEKLKNVFQFLQDFARHQQKRKKCYL